MIKSAIMTSALLWTAFSAPLADAQTQSTDAEAQQRIDTFISQQSKELGIEQQQLKQWLAQANVKSQSVLKLLG